VQQPVSVGVDVGGTFTDVVSFGSGTGDLAVLKFSTSSDPISALSAGLRSMRTASSEVSLLTPSQALLDYGHGSKTD
jgi:N-methylhydantoinase A/oxoprolinase/acetone carboxylase beta subunit